MSVEARIRRDRRRFTVTIAEHNGGRLVGAVSSTFARSAQARSEAIAWCRRKGVTRFTIVPSGGRCGC